MVITAIKGQLFEQSVERCLYYLYFAQEVKKADCHLCESEHRGTSKTRF